MSHKGEKITEILSPYHFFTEDNKIWTKYDTTHTMNIIYEADKGILILDNPQNNERVKFNNIYDLIKSEEFHLQHFKR